MQTINIEGALRNSIGKKATKETRKQDLVPCVLYGGKENIHFSSSQPSVKKIIFTPNLYKANLQIEGRNFEAIVKDVQYHPVSDAILHIDFQELVDGVNVITHVPVKTIGTSEGVKKGGKLLLNVRKLKVKSTPDKLQDSIEIDVSHLDLGQSFKVRDIKGVEMEIMASPSIPMATIEIPRSLKSATTKAGKDGK